MPLGISIPGKVVRGDDPRARKPAASHVSRANALGGVLQSVEQSKCWCPRGEGSSSDNRGDGAIAFAVERDMFLSIAGRLARNSARASSRTFIHLGLAGSGLAGAVLCSA